MGRAPEDLSHAQGGPDTATEGEVIEYCKQHIAHFKAPAAMDFCDLPKTSTSKAQRFVEREKQWRGKEQRIS